MTTIAADSSQAQDLAREGRLRLSGPWALIAATLACGWSAFQLALADLLLLDSLTVRAIHLAFGLILAYLCFPFRRSGAVASSLTAPQLFGQLIVGIAAAGLALYFVFYFDEISLRTGALNQMDLIMGTSLIVVLLEAARRTVGPALPLIAGLFIAYSFCSESMPEIIAFKNASLDKLVNKLSLSTGGIYGVPLDVSANTVFLFVLFGVMLDKAGGSHFFIQFAYGLLGRFRGGPAKAAVLASGLTGMVSGSSIANTVTTGTFTIPLMRKAGYPAIKAGAIEVAASTNGQLMPPIMGAAAFIIAEYCGLSYFEVIVAALVPALAAYLTLIYITHLEACKLGIKGVQPKDLPALKPLVWGGLPFLLPLGFLLYQLMVMRRSPQLAVYAAILVLMALMIAQGMWRAWRSGAGVVRGGRQAVANIGAALAEGAFSMVAIAVAVATAGIVVGIVTLGLGAVITDLVELLAGGNLVLLLVITAVASLLLGMGLPTTANYIVMASLTVPVIVTLAADMGLVVPLIAAHLFCFYFGILADDTPPVALAAYAASAISKASPLATGVQGFIYDLRTAVLPFMFIFNTEILLLGVESFWYGLWVFATTLLGMMAFSALTQNWFYRRNRLLEAMGLAVALWLLLRPDTVVAWQPELSRWLVQFVGVSLLGCVYLRQRWAT